MTFSSLKSLLATFANGEGKHLKEIWTSNETTMERCVKVPHRLRPGLWTIPLYRARGPAAERTMVPAIGFRLFFKILLLYIAFESILHVLSYIIS